jgi:hypothetical protein
MQTERELAANVKAQAQPQSLTFQGKKSNQFL